MNTIKDSYLTIGTLLPFNLRPLCEENHVALCSYEGQNNVIKGPCVPHEESLSHYGVPPSTKGSMYEGWLCLPPYL